jgi:TorA maturation chaperone TorD
MNETHTAQQLEARAGQSSQEQEGISVEELVLLNERRATTYAMLSRLYRREVDQAYLDELRTIKYPVSTGNESASEGYLRIARYLSNVWENSTIELARDFAQCFIGEGMDSFSAAYPYESVYASEKRLLMQDARDEVLALIRSEGFDKNSTWKEMEDHIGLELEFMQRLAERLAKTLRAGDEEQATLLLVTQRNFLMDHLVSWTPQFIEDVLTFAQTDFYQGLALLTDGFLRSDAEFLATIAPEDSTAAMQEV